MAGDDAVPEIGDLRGRGEADCPGVETALAGFHIHLADEARAPVIADAVGHGAVARRRCRGGRRTGGACRQYLTVGLRDQHVKCHRNGNRGGGPEIEVEARVANRECERVRPAGCGQIGVRGVDEVSGRIHNDCAVCGGLSHRVGEQIAVGIGSADRSGDDRVRLTAQHGIRHRRLVEEQPVDLPADQRQCRGDEIQRTSRCAGALSRGTRGQNRRESRSDRCGRGGLWLGLDRRCGGGRGLHHRRGRRGLDHHRGGRGFFHHRSRRRRGLGSGDDLGVVEDAHFTVRAGRLAAARGLGLFCCRLLTHFNLPPRGYV